MGSQACARCHYAAFQQWAASRHARMMQPANRQSVEGNFAQGKVVLHRSTYLLRESAGKYFITESDLTGKSWEHPIEYTLGVRHVQHYVTTLPDGRMILIPAVWDNAAKKWIHDIDAGNPEESAGDPILVWNKTCYGCHASHEQKHYDAASATYHTTWKDPGVGCESCHGPGADHAAHPAKTNIVNPARLDVGHATAVCAQCHSNRTLYVDGFSAGAAYDDYFLPAMEYTQPPSDDPAFWPDGRPRWFANEAVALGQSQCYLKGKATCVTCHTQAHNPDVETPLRAANSSCARCHQTIAANPAAHTHHAPASAGSSCVECHMPRTSTGLHAQWRDHSMSVPAPENSARFGMPNACNLCHRDKDAGWGAQQVTAWYGAQAEARPVRRAEAFAAARQNQAEAIPLLAAILADPSEGPWIRANAAGWLGNFPNDPAAYGAVHRAFSDSAALVRATAAAVLRPAAGDRPAVAADLVKLLHDPVRTVRMSAAIAMVGMGVKPFAGEDGTRFEQAKALYRERAALFADDAREQFAAGRFFFMAGDMDGAAAAFRAVERLDPSLPARYPLARSLTEKGDYAGARQALQGIPPADPNHAAAQALLAEIASKETAGAPGTAAGESHFRDGRVRFQDGYYQAALNDFEEALRLSPQSEWAVQAQADRAICLEKLSRTAEAEAAMAALEANAAAQRDPDLQLAHIELLFDTGRAEEAEKRSGQAVAAFPQSAPAQFWRAKTLFALRRTGEAAKAAEESIRLQPELPEAHNLLIRIYQVEGRTREAAEQVEWLRDYERRKRSH